MRPCGGIDRLRGWLWVLHGARVNRLAIALGLVGRQCAIAYLRGSHAVFVLGMIGRLSAIERALDHDRRGEPLATRAPVPRPVWDAVMLGWLLATGRDQAAATKQREIGRP
jgi:hypothetical protein